MNSIGLTCSAQYFGILNVYRIQYFMICFKLFIKINNEKLILNVFALLFDIILLFLIFTSQILILPKDIGPILVNEFVPRFKRLLNQSRNKFSLVLQCPIYFVSLAIFFKTIIYSIFAVSLVSGNMRMYDVFLTKNFK